MLDHVFLTDLTNREIVLGKLAARLGPVWGLLAATGPVLAAATSLGGIDPMALVALFLVASAVAWLGCALALMLSVWADQPRDVLTVVHAAWAVWLLAGPVYQYLYLVLAPMPVWVRYTNPVAIAFRAGDQTSGVSLVEPVVFALGAGLLGAVCVLIAVARVRVEPRRLGAVGSRRVVGGFAWIGSWSRLREPKLDAGPVGWREWRRRRSSGWSRFVWVGYAVLATVAGVGLVQLAVRPPGPMAIPERLGVSLGLLTSLGLLLLTPGAASVLAEERGSGSLDVLWATPLSTRSIIRAKWRGSFRGFPGWPAGPRSSVWPAPGTRRWSRSNWRSPPAWSA